MKRGPWEETAFLVPHTMGIEKRGFSTWSVPMATVRNQVGHILTILRDLET